MKRLALCRWRTRGQRFDRPLPGWLRYWVDHTASLTARIKSHCRAGFAVRVVGEGWQKPTLDESRRLGAAPDQYAWIREVLLLCGGRCWVFARTVMPHGSLRRANRELLTLGNRPLGGLLFAGPRAEREPVEAARLDDCDWLRGRLQAATGLCHADRLWARRVVHYVRGRPILVAEVFLPEIADVVQ